MMYVGELEGGITVAGLLQAVGSTLRVQSAEFLHHQDLYRRVTARYFALSIRKAILIGTSGVFGCRS